MLVEAVWAMDSAHQEAVTGICSLLLGVRCHDPAKSLSAPQRLHHCAKHSSEITASSGCSEKILPRIFCHCALYLESKEHLNLSRLMIVALKSPLWLPVEMNAFDVRALQRNAVSS